MSGDDVQAKTRGGALTAAGLAAVMAWIGLPYALVQVLNLGLIREGKRGRKAVALTFDDGPDPQSTPAVLDALRAVGARGTFFVIAGRAQAHPELIGRMLAEGHQVEAHAVRHVHAWWRSPWGALLEPLRAVRAVQGVTGRPVKLHRPPHGAYTLATVVGQRLAGVRGAHWSIEGQDWQAARTPAQVRERLEALVVPGAVIVLHDAGPGARNTVPMLPDLLASLKARGYRFQRLNELEGAEPLRWPGVPRRLFLVLDALYDRATHTRPVGDRADNLYRMGLTSFPLSGVVMRDGTPVPRGTPVIEVHVNNAQMVDGGLRPGLRQTPIDQAVLAREIATDPKYRDVQFLFGLSSISLLGRLMGWEEHGLPPGLLRTRLTLWSRLLRRAFGGDPDSARPRLNVIKRADFLNRHGVSDAQYSQEDQP